MHAPHPLDLAAVAYCAAVASWFGLRWLVFDGVWWLALLNTAALALFVPLPLVALVLVWRRRRQILPALLLPALIFADLYGARFVPRPRPAVPAGSTALTAMTLNILYHNRDIAALRAAIIGANPDIVGLQEVTPARARALAAALAAEYPYAEFQVDGPESGVGLLSRYPISRAAAFPLPPRNLALHAVVDSAGTSVHVVVVHLSPNRALRTPPPRTAALARQYYPLKAAEVAQVLAELQAVAAPRIVMCDCNLTETSAAYAQLAAVLVDSFGEVGWGLGLTSEGVGVPVLVQRVDYIWHSPELRAEMAAVGPAGGSDHRSVVARLLLPPPNN